MVIYHLGFALRSYLAAAVFPDYKAIECHPIDDQLEPILDKVAGAKDFLFHLDLSLQHQVPLVRPLLVAALARAGIHLHNVHHTDQRKRHLQQASAQLGFESLTAPKAGDLSEKLIVKADLNVAGGPERRTVRRFPRLPLPPLPSRVCSPFEYYVARRSEIPDEVWADETLHIEKCIENPKGVVLRTFWNQGRGVVSVIENPHEVVKKRNEKCRRWNYSAPVDTLTETVFSRQRRYAEHLQLSFFAADWVVDEAGAPFIVDLNLTPQWVVNSGTHTNNMTPNLSIYDIPNALKGPR